MPGWGRFLSPGKYRRFISFPTMNRGSWFTGQIGYLIFHGAVVDELKF